MTRHVLSRRTVVLASAVMACAWIQAAQAHDFGIGELRIDHPYATPSVPGASNGAVYFRGIRNRGTAPDRLVAASTPVAERVELHEMTMDGDIMRMREVPGIDLPVGQEVQLRHGQRYHLMLLNLRQPLVVGDRFDVTLKFERAGEVRVKAWVQQPRGPASQHQH